MYNYDIYKCVIELSIKTCQHSRGVSDPGAGGVLCVGFRRDLCVFFVLCPEDMTSSSPCSLRLTLIIRKQPMLPLSNLDIVLINQSANKHNSTCQTVYFLKRSSYFLRCKMAVCIYVFSPKNNVREHFSDHYTMKVPLFCMQKNAQLQQSKTREEPGQILDKVAHTQPGTVI